MTKSKSTIKDICNVMSSNIITLLSSVVTGLVVPKILGATDYGYYRIFVLYTTYACLLHFGIVDGILLKDGGIRFNQLNKKACRSDSILFAIMQLGVVGIFILISVCISNTTYSIIIIFVGISAFFMNFTAYYRYISQAVMRFRELSIRNTIQASLVILFTLILFIFVKYDIMQSIKYYTYIILMVIIYFIMFLIYFISYKEITLGDHDSFKRAAKRLIYYSRIGIFLTIAYQISNLILIIDNQFVASFFRASVYGKYSFSYSMAASALTILSAVSTVLLPHLEQDSRKYIISVYHKMISLIMLIVYLGLLAYFPLCILIKIILPEYVQSLSYLKIFLPELGITCSVTMITFNYYNALGKSKFYFYMSLVVLTISIVIDSVMYMLFHDPVLVAFGSFIAIFIWYLSSEYFLVKWYHVQWMKNLIYMMLMIGSFFMASMVPNLVVGFIIYLVIYLVVSWVMFNNIIKKNVKIIISKI